jgi:hypothetical protein
MRQNETDNPISVEAGHPRRVPNALTLAVALTPVPPSPHPIRPALALGRVLSRGPLGSAHSFDRTWVRRLDVDRLPCARSPCFVREFCTRAGVLCRSNVFAGLQIAREGVRRRWNKGKN